jgi:hypothetical protein
MTGKTTTFSSDFLKLILNAVAIANIADNASSSPLTNIYIGLHTSDPGVSGNQTTNEISYTGYARVAVSRSSGSPAWTVTSNAISPNSAVTFGAMTAGAGGTATHVGIGTASSSTGKLLWSGAISPTISCVNGVTPQLTTASAVTET